MFRVKLLRENCDYKKARWYHGDMAILVDESGNKILLFLMPNGTYAMPAIVEQLCVDGLYRPFDAFKFVADRNLSAGVWKITEGNKYEN